jgi:LysM repeat protein
MFWKSFTILLLVAGILGGSAYFLHELYYKEKKLDVVEQTATPTPTPEPTPDPAIAAFEALKPTLAQTTPAAREALVQFLEAHPVSPVSAEARAALGRINLALFRDPVATPTNTVYTVKKGDSLVRIASIHKSNAELIYWANELSTINLQIGQQLLVPVFDAALIVDRTNSTLTLFNNGEFFKEYPASSIQIAAAGPLETKVLDRIARKGETRVAFGHKDYPETERLVLLGTGGISIRQVPAPAEDGTTPPNPPGIVLAPQDFAEIFVLVKTGTPVTIN